MNCTNYEKIGKKYVWGTVFILIHFNLGNITILPSWLGWLILSGAINDMVADRKNEKNEHDIVEKSGRMLYMAVFFCSYIVL